MNAAERYAATLATELGDLTWMAGPAIQAAMETKARELYPMLPSVQPDPAQLSSATIERIMWAIHEIWPFPLNPAPDPCDPVSVRLICGWAGTSDKGIYAAIARQVLLTLQPRPHTRHHDQLLGNLAACCTCGSQRPVETSW